MCSFVVPDAKKFGIQKKDKLTSILVLPGLVCDAKADEALKQCVQNSIPVTQLPGYLNCNHA